MSTCPIASSSERNLFAFLKLETDTPYLLAILPKNSPRFTVCFLTGATILTFNFCPTNKVSDFNLFNERILLVVTLYFDAIFLNTHQNVLYE